MIRIRKILEEMTGMKSSRFNTETLSVIFEKLVPTLPKEKQTDVEKHFANLMEQATKINETRYSIFNIDEYDHLVHEINEPICELKECLSELLKTSSETVCIDSVKSALKVLDDLYITQ